MKKLIPTTTKCEVHFEESKMDTIAGLITGSKQFIVTATIEFISNGDFSEFEHYDPRFQIELNNQLAMLVTKKLLNTTIALNN